MNGLPAVLRDVELLWLMVATATAALLLLRLRSGDRHTVWATLAWLLLGLLLMAGGEHAGGAGFAAIGGTVREAGAVLLGLAAIRMWSVFLFRLALPAAGLKPPRILEDVLTVVAYVAYGMVRLSIAGLALSQLVTTSALITAAVAFSMQDTLGNILGGLALQLDDSLRIGDWIKVDDVTGRVVEIGWRSTSVETRNWETVVVPNSQLMKTRFIVLGRHGEDPVQWRRWIWFNVDLGHAPQRVITTVDEAVRAAEIPHVAREPRPNCLLMDFDHGTGRYALRYWLTDLLRDDPTDSAVRGHLFAALQRAGMRIAVHEYSIHTVKESEKREQALRARELERRVHALRGVDLFARLSDEELATVAERLQYAPFARGDVITHQGAVAHWLYLITSGEADVCVEKPGQERVRISTLPAGSFFGEMGMMTGEARAATVVARTDAECYRLDKDAFQDILLSRPAIAEDISRVLAVRRTELESAQQGLDAEARARRLDESQNEILGRIRRFFGLEA